ncbi:hypothetical protein KCU98_g65, partial [Aureobasidium melanogenum]
MDQTLGVSLGATIDERIAAVLCLQIHRQLPYKCVPVTQIAADDLPSSRIETCGLRDRRIRLSLKRIATVATRKTFSGERSPASSTPPHETPAAVCPVFYDLVPALDWTLVALMLGSWLAW